MNARATWPADMSQIQRCEPAEEHAAQGCITVAESALCVKIGGLFVTGQVGGQEGAMNVVT